MQYNYREEKEEGCFRRSFCALGSSGRQETKRIENSDREIYLTFDQPQRIAPPMFEPQIPRPVTAISEHSRSKSWFKNDRASQSYRSRSSSFTTLKRPFSSHGGKKGRPSISHPTDFRRVAEPTEPMPARRRSFRPLTLLIEEPTGRLSPLPDFETDQWELKMPQLTKPPAAMLQRETVDNSQLNSENNVPRKPLSSYSPRRDVVSEPFLLAENGPGPVMETEVTISDLGTIDEDRTPTLSAPQMDDMLPDPRPWSQRSSSYSIGRIRSPSPFSKHSRSESGSRSTKASIRRSKNDTVEEAIRELNTIVEENRIKAKLAASAASQMVPSSPTSHVPAIAPSMSLRARSETLSDIGSAFSVSASRSASTQGRTQSPLPLSRRTASAVSIDSTSSSATALPALPLQSHPIAMPTTRNNRLSTWFSSKRSTPSSPDTPEPPAPQKFYQLSMSKDMTAFPIHHSRSSASFSTISTVTSISTPRTSSFDVYTASSTVASPRPSFSQTPKAMRRAPKNNLSIDTTVTKVPDVLVFEQPPPSYGLPPNPVTPSRIGVAC